MSISRLLQAARAICAALTWLLASTLVDAAERPNFLVVLCDDLGFSDLACYGGEIRTPNLDRLAAEGLRFTQFYNCAVCVTTRAALVTGLHPRRATGTLRADMVTIAEVLRAAGYQTSLTGKWHLGSAAPRRPIDRGFDEYYGVLSGCCNYFNPARPDPIFYNGGLRRPFAHNTTPVTEFPPDFYSTDAFTEHAIATIRRFAAAGKPFFAHLCYTAPHFPLQAWPEDIARYRGRYDEGYFVLRQQRHQRQLAMGLVDPRWRLSPPDPKVGPWRYDYEIVPWERVEDLQRERRRMEVYAAMVDRLDQGIGRVLDALRDCGLERNTVVMFLSDNGGCASLPAEAKMAEYRQYNRKLPGPITTYEFCGPGWGWAQNTPFRRYKTWNYEGGIATPLIVRWPGVVRPNTITHQVGHVVDVLPTCAELAGTAYPQQLKGQPVLPAEGKSLVPVLHGQTRPGHETLCWALFGNRAVRQGRWKLVWGVTRGVWELYDMESDRTETCDLAQDHPQRVEEMSRAWFAWAQRTEVATAEKDASGDSRPQRGGP